MAFSDKLLMESVALILREYSGGLAASWTVIREQLNDDPYLKYEGVCTHVCL